MKFMTRVHLFALLSIGFGIAFLQGCQENSGAVSHGPPKIEVIGGDTVNWGDVGGGELHHTLKIVNVGGDTLKISEVKPSCGCTTAPLDKDMLLFGDTAVINLTMDVANKHGETSKTLRVVTNDSTSPVTTVFLKANVVQHIVAEPAYFSISELEPGTEGTSKIVLRNVGKETITVQPPLEVDTPLMAVKFSMTSPVKLNPGDSLPVTVYATPLNPGPSAANYIFKTDSKMSPEVKVGLSVSTSTESNVSVQSTTPQVSVAPSKGK